MSADALKVHEEARQVVEMDRLELDGAGGANQGPAVLVSDRCQSALMRPMVTRAILGSSIESNLPRTLASRMWAPVATLHVVIETRLRSKICRRGNFA